MPSLDGYSLNQKIDRLNDDVQAQIDQLKKDFHNLYSYIKKLEEPKVEEKVKRAKSKTAKKEKAVDKKSKATAE
jgi:outer membrane murein-binding lipoprotein Lpp